MSVVICYRSDYLSLIVTDTRISYGCSMNNTIGYSDDNEKLIRLPIGWCAGAGVDDFIKDIANDLSSKEISNINHVADVYNSVYKTISNSTKYNKKEIDISAVAVAYAGMFENDIIPHLNIALLSKSNVYGNQCSVVNKEEIYILYPIEYIENGNLVSNFNNRFPLKYKFDGNVEKIIKYILQIFKEISNNSNSVNNVCDIGLMAIDNNGFHKFRIKDNIEALLDDIDNGKINSHIIE